MPEAAVVSGDAASSRNEFAESAASVVPVRRRPAQLAVDDETGRDVGLPDDERLRVNGRRGRGHGDRRSAHDDSESAHLPELRGDATLLLPRLRERERAVLGHM